MASFAERLQHAWNAFTNADSNRSPTFGYGASISSVKPDRHRLSNGNDRSIIAGMYTRFAIDVSTVEIEHVQLDANKRYSETINDGLNNCLTLEANKDQTARSFIIDLVLSMFDEGVVAAFPVEAKGNPTLSEHYDILSLRTAKILEWYPDHIKIRAYDERDGQYKEIIVPKATTAIIENPLYSVTNDRSSILQRLLRVMNLIDVVNDQTGSGKLDLIIQLPYAIKSEERKRQADARRKDIEMQLSTSKFGIAYTDATEKIVQLNRSVENHLLEQQEYLIKLLYSQLGVSENIFNGTANEQELLNYHNRTIQPIVNAIVDEMKRKFLSKNARTRGQTIYAFKDPFKLVPVNQLADIVDKFTRNEVMTSNEFRQVIGMKPSSDPGADELRNKNMPIEETGFAEQEEDILDANDQAALDDIDGQIDELERMANA